MKYICCATVQQLPNDPGTWLEFIIHTLKLNPAQAECVQKAAVFKHSDHIQASCFFRTAFEALHYLRAANLLSIALDNEHHISDLAVRFTRYENTVFFFFIIETPKAPESEPELIQQQDQLLALLNESFAPKLSFDFHVTAKVEEFKELLRYQSLTPVYEVGETVSQELLKIYVNQHQGEDYQRHYKIAYASAFTRQNTGDGKSIYVREQRGILCLNTALNKLSDGQSPDVHRSQFYNVIQTEAAFFYRTWALENSLLDTYQHIDFLRELVDIMQNQWVKIRSLFAISPKFSLVNRSHTSQLFFNLLEVNAQVTALQSKIATRLDQEYGPMQERYERLHFNISNAQEDEQAYFHHIHNQVLKSFNAYVERMGAVNRSITRLNEGIAQLREDFDSNTNVIVQMLMFLFSVVMVFWGLVVFLADKGMGVIPYKFTFPVLTGVGLAALGVIFSGYMLIARMYANRSAKVMESSVHNGIERCLTNCPNIQDTIENMVQDYLTDSGNQRKLGVWHAFKIRKNKPAIKSMKYLFKVTHCLEVFSTLLPAVSLNQYSPAKANLILKDIRSKFPEAKKCEICKGGIHTPDKCLMRDSGY